MLWVKAFHVVFVVMWYAGLFYLPRLFVYHAMCDDQAGNERFKVMERKLFAITNVGAAGALALGGWLLWGYWEAFGTSAWMHAKLALVALQVAHHAWCGKLMLDFRVDANRHGHRFYRIINEIPALTLIAIVILVIVKPF